MTKKRKNTKGWMVDVDDDLYKKVKVRSAREGWKISTFLRWILGGVVDGDDYAEAALRQHMIDEGLVEDDEE